MSHMEGIDEPHANRRNGDADSALDTGLDRSVDGVAADARRLDDETRRLLEVADEALRKIAETMALVELAEQAISDFKQRRIRRGLAARAWEARN